MVVQTTEDLRQLIADVFGFDGVPRSAPRALLPRSHLCFLGFGSLARPMAERARDHGVLDFTLVDFKRYVEKSIASQCEPDDVGHLKVDVAARRLSGRGARVTLYPCDLFNLPDGAVHKNSMLIVSADNHRADIGANRLAVRMQVPLLKVNVEPAYHVVSVRAFDFRASSPVCVECNFPASRYDRQAHPKSCDGTAERPTGSPRILSQAAAELGMLALLEILEESRADRWFNHEMLLCLETGLVTWSELTPNCSCKCCGHERRWPAIQRLASGPESISLAELVRCASIVLGESTTVRFCQQVALRSRCEACGHEVCSPRWLTELDASTGDCPHCGKRLLAVPFFLHSELRLKALAAVLEQPLAAWGVAPAAVIELAGEAGRRAFVIGSDRLRAHPSSAHPVEEGTAA